MTEAEEILATAEAWWDVDRSNFRDGDRYLRNIGQAGSVLDLRLGSSVNANSNDPKYLAPEDIGYAYLPGVSGCTLTTPDTAALHITGDIDIRVLVALDSYSTSQSLVDKWRTAGQQAYGLALSNGQPYFTWSTTGSDNAFGAASGTSLSTTTAAGQPIWIRATFQPNRGDGKYETKYYTSPDGSTWTQQGVTRTGASAATVFAGTSILAVGDFNITNQGLGKFYRVQILSGISGTTVLDINCDAIAAGSTTTFTEQSSNAATVTINRATSGRKTVAMPSKTKGGRPLMLLGTDDFLDLDASQRALYNVFQGDNLTALITYRQWATPSISAPIMMCRNAIGNTVGWAIRNNSTTLQAQAVISDVGGTANTVSPSGTYSAGALATAILTINRSIGLASLISAGNTGTLNIRSYQSLMTTTGFRIGLTPDTIGPSDWEFRAAAIWRRALTSREIAVLNNAAPWGA
jgi:hypothetical protein